MGQLPATLSLKTNPTGIGSAIAAIYALGQAVWNATHHHAAIDPQVVLGALTAAAFLYTRFKVTPVAAPRDGAGTPLVPAPAAAPPATPGGGGSVHVVPPAVIGAPVARDADVTEGPSEGHQP